MDETWKPTNELKLKGLLVNDPEGKLPEIQFTPNGHRYIKARLNVPYTSKKNGQTEQIDNIFEVTAWGAQADIIAGAKQGEKLVVDGYIRNSVYMSKNTKKPATRSENIAKTVWKLA